MWPKLSLKNIAPLGSGRAKENYPELKKDGSNSKLFFVADVVGDKSFSKNYGGYPLSDISLINEQQNAQVAQVMLEKLRDYHTEGNPNYGKSDVQVLLGMQSKYCQTASECVRYVESQLKRMEVEGFNKSDSQSNDGIGFNKDDAKSSADEAIDNA